MVTPTWQNNQAPGPMQAGDELTILARVFNPGQEGPIYYWGAFSATATAITPGTPSQVSWMLA